MQLVNDCHLTFDGLVFTLVLCGLWANHMWRLMCLALAYFVIVPAIGGSAPAACSHRCTAHALPACAGAFTSDSCPIYEPIVRGWSAAPILWFLMWKACMHTPLLSFLNPMHKRQKAEGAVFVTGADSGMGHWTASHLCAAGCAALAYGRRCYPLAWRRPPPPPRQVHRVRGRLQGRL